MDILIISNIRCGGYYFSKQLSETYNLQFFHEPRRLVEPKEYNGLCVKILSDWPVQDEEQIIAYSKKFDYVFLLDRKDKEAQFKSTFTLYEYTKKMTSPWTWDKNIENTVEYTKKERVYKKWIYDKTVKLNTLSSISNTPILYYEDLYFKKNETLLKGLDFVADTSQKLFSSNISEVKNKNSNKNLKVI